MYLSVNARTAEEADEIVKKITNEVNVFLRPRGAILQQSWVSQLPEPA
jgi:hypothetical protein